MTVPDKQQTGDCIPWTGAVNSKGYGTTTRNGRTVRAHRVVWEQEFGTIPDGMVIDHLCRNRRCVNTKHMEIVTPRENTLRGFGPPAQNARKTRCKHGHELSGNNLMLTPKGERVCRECARGRFRAYRLRKIEAGTWTRT